MTTTKTKTIRARLIRLGACEESIKKYGDMTADEAWAACDSPDDLAWIVCRVAGTRGNLTRRQHHGVMADVLELTLPKAGASRKVVETVVALLRRSADGGEVSADEWAAAAADAAEAAWTACMVAAADAAWGAWTAASGVASDSAWATDAAAHISGKAAVVDAIKARVEVRGGKLVMKGNEHGKA